MIGTVSELHRYPVKSMQGHPDEVVQVGADRIDGDRSWGLIDVDTGRLASAKRFRALLDATGGDGTATLPDGSVVDLAGPGADAALSAWLGRSVRVVRAEESHDLSYQMTFDPPDDDAELFDIPVPPQTLLDLGAVHLISRTTLDHCAAARPDLNWDLRRFRPNVVADLDTEPFAENDWSGRSLRLGDDVVLGVMGPTVRCAMPLRAQPGGLERQPGLTAALNELNVASPNHLGLYLHVEAPGTVRVGDAVVLV